MNFARVSAVALTALLVAGCGGSSTSPAPSGPESVERAILPNATDPAIDVNLDPHIAINPDPAIPTRNVLFVFLPGTGALPAQYRLILRAGAARGYHALGLCYPNDDAVGVLCDGSEDASCQWDIRREVVTGADTSPLVSVHPANSIVNRLEKALAYLHAQYPDEGWGQYLVNGHVDWNRVEVAGHSQGGGHAAAIAKLRAVWRAVYFASPADWRTVQDVPPAWLAVPGATDASRQYGFTHVMDATVLYSRLTVTWSALGMGALGAPFSVDGAAAPYGDSHELTTAAAPQGGEGGLMPYHAAPVFDAATPLTGTGAPLYAPVWNYLCFP